jgi:hypothetical protein
MTFSIFPARNTRPAMSARRGAAGATAPFVFALLTLSCCGIPREGFAAIPAGERQVLVNLYNATNGGAWTSNANWCNGACPGSGTPTFNSAGSECTWYGITCDSGQAHVTAVALANNHLAGTLPALGGLTRLQYFTVESNDLSGALPALGALADLQTFYAGYNRLSGSIPALSGLANLGDFNVAHNQLTGAVPGIGGLASLYSFSVADNRLTGSVASVGAQANLRVFDVGGNQLTGSIPALSGAPELLRAAFDRNRLSGTIPTLPGKLYSAQFAFNALSGSVPAAPASLFTPSAFASSRLCPNPLATSASANDAGWNGATGYAPWWATPYPGNRCDDLQADGFD